MSPSTRENDPSRPAEPDRVVTDAEQAAEAATRATTPRAAAADEDTVLLREEVAALRAQLDTRARRQRRWLSTRKVVAAVLVFLAAFGTTASVIGVWSARTTLNTDRWVSTVTPLASDPQVKAAVSTYMTDQVYSSLNVPSRVRQALPPQAGFLAVPLSNQVKDFIHSSVTRVLNSPQFATLWPQLNRNESNVVGSSGQTVTLNLLPVVNETLRQLQQQVPTLFGKQLNLPPVNITNGQIPPDLRNRIETQLGITLPANFARLTIYRGNELKQAQDAVVAFKKSVVMLVLGTLIALALALWISPRRRRTLLQFGVWLVIWVVVLSNIIKAVRNQVLDQVQAGVYRDGASAAVHIVFTTLRERGNQLIWIGAILAVVCYLIGPGRLPVWLRHQVARLGRATWRLTRRGAAVAVADGPGFARRYLDPLRLGGVAVAAIAALWFSSWTALAVILVLLGAYELVLTLMAGTAGPAVPAEAAGAEPGEASPSARVPAQPSPGASQADVEHPTAARP
jgi:hypothetical protein